MIVNYNCPQITGQSNDWSIYEKRPQRCKHNLSKLLHNNVLRQGHILILPKIILEMDYKTIRWGEVSESQLLLPYI